MNRRLSLLAALLLVVLVGCGPAPVRGPDTGARDLARGYCEALIAKDWARAYAALHSETRRRMTLEQFAQRATAFRRRFGFEPKKVNVRACEEHGTQAIAHVLFVGEPSAARRPFRDGVVLHTESGGWRVVLPPTFGR